MFIIVNDDSNWLCYNVMFELYQMYLLLDYVFGW